MTFDQLWQHVCDRNPQIVNGDGTVSILDMIFTRNRLGANCP